MAIEFVGYQYETGFGNLQQVSLTSLTGGIDTAARTGDIVVGAVGYCANGQQVGWDENDLDKVLLVDGLWVNASRDTSLDVAYWIMGATPLTSVSYAGTSSNGYAQAAVVLVYRNVSSTSPIDVTTTTASGSGTAYPDSPAITPITPGSVVLAVGTCTSDTSPVNKTGPANMGTFYQTKDSGNAITGCLTGIAVKYDWTSGSFDPAAWTGGESTASDSWAAATIVLRPASEQQNYISLIVNT